VTEANDKPRYVYGVVRAGTARPAVDGIAGAALELVPAGEVAALTSAAPERLREAGRDELLAHSRVLEAAFDQSTVLPMRFGVVFPDAETLRGELLEGHRGELATQLADFDGKVEIAIKGVYHEQAILREIVAENREIAALRTAIQSKPEPATYLQRIRLGELVAEAFAARQERDSAALAEALRPYALAVTVGEPIHERMALNASYLVEREALPAFDRAVDELGSRERARVRLHYTGPLPPYSFVELGAAA
jgi:Gas vesicle synthesis protein GvpL/GvpF